MTYALLYGAEAHETCWEDAAEAIGRYIEDDRAGAFCCWESHLDRARRIATVAVLGLIDAARCPAEGL